MLHNSIRKTKFTFNSLADVTFCIDWCLPKPLLNIILISNTYRKHWDNPKPWRSRSSWKPYTGLHWRQSPIRSAVSMYFRKLLLGHYSCHQVGLLKRIIIQQINQLSRLVSTDRHALNSLAIQCFARIPLKCNISLNNTPQTLTRWRNNFEQYVTV